DGVTSHVLIELTRLAMTSDVKKGRALGAADGRHIGLAKAGGRLHQRAKHRPEVERRAADNFQHFRCRGLLLQRFAKLVKQASVLDSNHRLLGEVGDKFDLSLSERPNLLAENANNANQFTLFKHGHTEEGSCTTEVDQHPHAFDAAKVSRLVSEVG